MKTVMMYDEWSDETDNESEIIKQLKEKLAIIKKSGVTNYVYGWKSKRSCEGEGVFATPNPKLGYP